MFSTLYIEKGGIKMKNTNSLKLDDLKIPQIFIIRENVKVDQLSGCRICSSEEGGLICD